MSFLWESSSIKIPFLIDSAWKFIAYAIYQMKSIFFWRMEWKFVSTVSQTLNTWPYPMSSACSNSLIASMHVMIKRWQRTVTTQPEFKNIKNQWSDFINSIIAYFIDDGIHFIMFAIYNTLWYEIFDQTNEFCNKKRILHTWSILCSKTFICEKKHLEFTADAKDSQEIIKWSGRLLVAEFIFSINCGTSSNRNS